MDYDVIIIGSGLGGLLCGSILGKEGLRVCVVEKNKQLGGNLQTFSRNKQLFDTGVHYIGGLAKGQNLYQVFKYAGIMDQLRLEKMEEAFDHILLENDPKEYVQSQGYDAFIKNLVADFPEEKEAIIRYCERVKEVCGKFPLYHLTTDDASVKNNVLGLGAQETIASITNNKKLQAVLAGNNLLYSGVAGKTPFHVHALIVNSYIESSWKCVDGGSQIAKLLAAEIKKHGGTVLRNCEVKKIVETNRAISHIEIVNGATISARYFISNINPAATLNLTNSPLLKNVYRKRISGLPNTVSSFSLHLVLKPRSVPYKNHNYYFHKDGCLWNMNDYTEANWPLGYGLYYTRDRKNPSYAATISVLTPMWFRDVEQWKDTYNRKGKESNRGTSYEAFKKRKTAQLLKLVKERFPEIVENIQYSYAATPLTNRDYIGLEDGSMYGVQKDYKNPLQTVISPRTKIPNLFLTGQSLNLHGILGTSLSAVLTCSLLLNDDTLVDKIRNV
ncbi:all-trans-retinol 13,14-reductase [Niabella ginsenosidivorans]|uniref:All-trans-retinol 13,14-reductase n=1 Tax=Niabella ginsenosidivorans TaxID=1176587 RepID=A0A1A9HWQ0_9BACT|nr:FAD-dependent oxidoreductase [Niabella ginsenosidivorans]ANH79663.1 all-trans-retinol 13,14-reductase [Niabella ginsenosidivorans]